MSAPSALARLDQTRQAFQALAAGYDRSEESNERLVSMRNDVWRRLLELFPAGSRLLDLGCGTGIDAVYLAVRDRVVVATDISPAMLSATRERALAAGVGHRIGTFQVAIEELDRLPDQQFGGIYSNRGPFNCVDDLRRAADNCADLLPSGGYFVATVIGRWCPWEMAFYGARGDWGRAFLRLRRGFVEVPLEGEIVPTRYFSPREFYVAFADYFELVTYRGLGLFAPPSYLASVVHRGDRRAKADRDGRSGSNGATVPTAGGCASERRAARLRPAPTIPPRPVSSFGMAAEWMDARFAGLPVLRSAGDLFLIVLRRR
ncbi:MAG TPA: methyltransferase domain-containing protein [Chloroflexota bacterium]|nr:methyltransferase domain-containing protein [Chloroflexota bacterium]